MYTPFHLKLKSILKAITLLFFFLSGIAMFGIVQLSGPFGFIGFLCIVLWNVITD